MGGGRPDEASPGRATFPRSPTWAREENPGGPGESRKGLGEPPGRRMGERKEQGEVPEREVGAGRGIPPGGEILGGRGDA